MKELEDRTLDPGLIRKRVYLGAGFVFLMGTGLGLAGSRWFGSVRPVLAVHDPGNELQLKSLVEEVKAELEQADHDRQSQGEAPLFLLKDFDLELTFVVHNHAGAKGEFKPALVAVDADVALDTDRAQKVTIHMVAAPPIPGETHPTLVSDKPPPPKRRGDRQ